MSVKLMKNNLFSGYVLVGLILATGVYALYTANLVIWSDGPDYGWRTMYPSGPNLVAEVFPRGEEAGLKVGDIVVAVNGKTYSTFEDLFFRLRHDRPGAVNTYAVTRDGSPLEIRVTNGRLGLGRVIRRSGPVFLVGFVYVLIGLLVFLMKPQALESRVFFLMNVFMGLHISCGAPSDLLRPLWFFDLRLFVEKMLPATVIHLALIFPAERTFVREHPWVCFVPYGASLLLFLTGEAVSPSPWDVPPILIQVYGMYLFSSALFFLVSLMWNMWKDPSIAVRIQSRMIFIGMFLGILIPVAEMLIRLVWKVYLFRDPAVGFALFLSVFPLSIGYTIVKLDLFTIDVIVRRTYGYVLSTAAIIGSYAVIITTLNVVFRSSEVSRSPLFSIGFALGVVFFFKPLHDRFQGFVDRVFYRQRYDYRKTIKDISEAMTSILDPGQIQKKLIGSVVREMFLENGLMMLRDPGSDTYRVHVAEGEDPQEFAEKRLDAGTPIVRFLEERSDPIFRHEIDLNPRYKSEKEELRLTFQSLSAESFLPLRYKDQMRGIVSLGRKKSGKMFMAEDIDLLKTIMNQSAIALENAKLFEENLEKGRMEEELKIAREIQVSMLPDKAPAIEGFSIVARSVPAREVGGDFYDFIEVGGEGSGKKLAIVIGDVSGKAVSGALVMAASRSIFRILTETQASVEEVMNLGNSRLLRDVKKGMFVAVLYAVLDARNNTLTLSNAGQTQPIICSPDHPTPVYLDTDGDKFPLGIVKDCQYQETVVPLIKGDTVVFYTDGVVEAVNGRGELYGFGRLLTSIEEGHGMGANAYLEKLLEDVSHYVGDAEQHDDITIVVVKAE